MTLKSGSETKKRTKKGKPRESWRTSEKKMERNGKKGKMRGKKEKMRGKRGKIRGKNERKRGIPAKSSEWG